MRVTTFQVDANYCLKSFWTRPPQVNHFRIAIILYPMKCTMLPYFAIGMMLFNNLMKCTMLPCFAIVTVILKYKLARLCHSKISFLTIVNHLRSEIMHVSGRYKICFTSSVIIRNPIFSRRRTKIKDSSFLLHLEYTLGIWPKRFWYCLN